MGVEQDAALAAYAAHYVDSGNQKRLDKYRQLFETHEAFSVALEFDQFDAFAQNYFWEVVEATEMNGGPLMTATAPAALPAPDAGDTPTNITATAIEARESYYSTVAHNLWLEANNVLPWKLGAHDATILSKMWSRTDPSTGFNSWQVNGLGSANWSGLCDHRIDVTYNGALALLGGVPTGSEYMTVVNLLWQMFQAGWQHSGGSDDLCIVTMEHALTERIARRGCNFAAKVIASLSRAINIPAYLSGEVLGVEGEALGHSTTVWPGLNAIMGHADNIYGSNGSFNRPDPNILRDLRYYESDIFIYDNNDLEAARRSAKEDLRSKFHAYDPPPNHVTVFLRDGWDSPLMFQDWATLAESGDPDNWLSEDLPNYYWRLVAVTGRSGGTTMYS